MLTNAQPNEVSSRTPLKIKHILSKAKVLQPVPQPSLRCKAFIAFTNG